MKNNYFANILWNLLEKIGIQIVNAIVSIILARLLDPSDYGNYTIVATITSVIIVVVDLGLPAALIQKENTDNLDYSTVFWTNVIVCGLFYLLVCLLSTSFSHYYGEEEKLALYIKVCAFRIIISAIKNVQEAYVSKNLLFKKYFITSTIGTVIAAIAGVLLALTGYGVWALIVLNLLDYLIDMFLTCFIVKWRPTFEFSFERLKSLLNFSWKVSLTSIVSSIFDNYREIIVGKKFSLANLAFYDKGSSLSNKIVVTINDALKNVTFPFFSNNQNDINKIKTITQNTIKTTMYVMLPMIAGFVAVSNTFIEVVYTNKWMPAVPFIVIISISNCFIPISDLCSNVIKSQGRSDLILKVGVYSRIIDIIILIISLCFGLRGMAVGCVVSRAINTTIYLKETNDIIDYGITNLIIDLFPSLLISSIMGLLVFVININMITKFALLVVKVLTGIIIYIVMSFLFNKKQTLFFVNLVKETIVKKD